MPRIAVNSELRTYYQEIADFLCAARARGFCLSTTEQDAIVEWYHEGVALPVVLRAIDHEARTQRARGRAVTLPLRAIERHVRKELKAAGGTASSRQATDDRDTMTQSVPNDIERVAPEQCVADQHLAYLVQRLHALSTAGSEAQRRLYSEFATALATLRSDLQSGFDAARIQAQLLGIARIHYDRWLEEFPEERMQLEAGIQHDLGPALARMRSSARAETLREATRRALQRRDGIALWIGEPA